MGVQDLSRIEERIDRTEAGSIAVSDSAGGVMFEKMVELMDFAKIMAISKQAVPQHCRGEVGICLAIAIQAVEWRFSPYAVANKSYVVNDRVAYESQLIHAVIEARAPLQSRLRCSYDGEGTEMRCTISGLLKREKEPHEYTSPRIKDIKVKNSPLWASDPQQQLFYFASRAWARKWAPDALLGIYTADELEGDKIKDVTPPKPDVGERLKGSKGKRGFSHEGVTAALEHKSEQALNTIGAEPEKQPEPVVSAPDPEQLQTASRAEQPKHEEPEPLSRGKRLLGKLKAQTDIADLRATIADELSGGDLATWNAACDEREASFQTGRKDAKS